MHFHGLACSRQVGLDVRNIFFRNVGRHPYVREIGDHEQFFRGFHDLAFGQIASDDPAVEGSHDRNMGADRVIAIQIAQVFVGQTQKQQAISCFLSFGAKAEHFPFAPLGFSQPDDLFFQEQLCSPKGSVGDVQFGRGFEIGRLSHAELAAIEEGQEGAAFHFPAEVGIHVDHSTADQRGDFGQGMFIRFDGAGKISRKVRNSPRVSGLDDDSRRFDLLGGQTDQAAFGGSGRRVGPRGVWGRPFASGTALQRRYLSKPRPAPTRRE